MAGRIASRPVAAMGAVIDDAPFQLDPAEPAERRPTEAAAVLDQPCESREVLLAKRRDAVVVGVLVRRQDAVGHLLDWLPE